MAYFNLDLGGKAGSNESPQRATYERLASLVPAVDLERPLCETCSTQTSYQGADLDLESDDADHKCPICLDPRQYIGPTGQRASSCSLEQARLTETRLDDAP